MQMISPKPMATAPLEREAPLAFALEGLSKRYPGFALGPIDLSLQAGKVLALIGPNGAGKTTLMDCLAGMLRPSAGRICLFGREVDGRDPLDKQYLGYAGEETSFYENWSAARNLRFLAQFYPSWSGAYQHELVQRFGLPLDKPVRALSKGNRTKLALVAALAHRPPLVLLDEPTAGLDPLVRAEVLEVLWELLEKSEQAIFYSSHILSDISRLADELAFLKEGKLILRTTKEALEARYRRVSFSLDGELSATLKSTLTGVRSRGGEHQAISRDWTLTQSQLAALGAARIEATRLSIEEIAVQILKGGSDVAGREG